ncbi:MAG: SCO family protein [bacterium]
MFRKILWLTAFICGWTALATSVEGATPAFPVIGKTAPDFTLMDQSGQRIRLGRFRGKLVLLNFIYTRCIDVCPITTAALVRAQNGLIQRGWWATDVVFLSVTTDPERDTPAAFKTYAKRYQADARGWYFLSGSPSAVEGILKQYGILVREKAKGLQDHYLPTFVIDRQGVVLGAYGINPDPNNVLSDLAKLRR